MAEEQDKSSNSEQPTGRRLEKARSERGVPQSRELYHGLVWSALLLFIYWRGDRTFLEVFVHLKAWLNSIGTRPADGYALLDGAQHLLGRVLVLFLFLFGLLWCGILLVMSAQTHLRMYPLKMHWEKISPQKGLKRLFSKENVVEFLKSIVKILCVFALIFLSTRSIMDQSGALSGICVRGILWEIQELINRFLLIAVAVIILVSLSDYGFQWYTWFRNLFMSKKDIQDEHKETEKSAGVVSKQKRLRKEMSDMRAAAKAIPEATVVVMNPTHYAVAIAWLPHKMMAPEVVAKGSDRVALYIKKIATEHNVPVVNNKTLARSLFKTTNVGEAIPPQHYKAVATIIHYVMGLKETSRSQRQNR
jgi:flagellar biosynthetic protein FlhB